ncbi:MAG: prolipoprotein diacylglyceryl transferase [Nanoarchaeota archaeon]
MIPYQTFLMINLGFFNIYTWGLFVAIGFLVGIFLAIKEARKRKIKVKEIYDLSFYIILGGIVGGRIGYIPTHLNEFRDFLEVFKVWHGGMSFFGGFVFAALFAYFYIKKHKLNFWKYADVFALPLIIGHAIARVGCYLVGEHLGSPTNLPWGIFFEGAIRHPIPAYEFIALIFIALTLIYIKRFKLKDGILISSAVVMYSIIRFFLTFLRVDDPTFFGLTGSQYVSILLVVIFGSFIFKRLKG